MSAFSVIFDTLAADTTLTGILTGGIYNGLQLSEITREEAPDAFDEFMEMRPCAILKQEAQTPWGPQPVGSRLYVVLWLYAQRDMQAMDQARERVYTLLHRQYLDDGANHMFMTMHANDILGTEAQSLNVPTIASRYYVTVTR